MNHPFTVGQKVVCINDRFHPSIVEWGDEYPKLNRAYTVKRASFNPGGLTGIYDYSVLLAELQNPGDRLHFSAERFKPLAFLDKLETRKRVKLAYALARKAKANPQAEPATASRSLVVLVGTRLDESWEDFKSRVIQQFKQAGILKADGSSNLNRDGSFVLPPKTTPTKPNDTTPNR